MSLPSFDIDMVAALSGPLEGTSDNIAPMAMPLAPEALMGIPAAPQFSNSAAVTSDGCAPPVITTATPIRYGTKPSTPAALAPV